MITTALAVVLLLSLLIIPFGLPGIWVMILAAVAYAWFVPGASIGALAIIGCVAIALVSEVLDITVAARYTRKYGGSSRGAWGALVGGMVGAIAGVPVPIVGSVLGALVGSFLGALILELASGSAGDTAARAAKGAAVGRAVATALKVAAGCVIAAWILAAAIL
jgi:hypothetical protein